PHVCFFRSSRRRHTRSKRDWSSDVCSSDLHSQSLEAMFNNQPGLKIVMPSTPYDAKGLLKASIRDNDPVLFLEHKRAYRLLKEDLPEEDYTVPIGKADVK